MKKILITLLLLFNFLIVYATENNIEEKWLENNIDNTENINNSLNWESTTILNSTKSNIEDKKIQSIKNKNIEDKNIKDKEIQKTEDKNIKDKEIQKTEDKDIKDKKIQSVEDSLKWEILEALNSSKDNIETKDNIEDKNKEDKNIKDKEIQSVTNFLEEKEKWDNQLKEILKERRKAIFWDEKEIEMWNLEEAEKNRLDVKEKILNEINSSLNKELWKIRNEFWEIEELKKELDKKTKDSNQDKEDNKKLQEQLKDLEENLKDKKKKIDLILSEKEKLEKMVWELSIEKSQNAILLEHNLWLKKIIEDWKKVNLEKKEENVLFLLIILISIYIIKIIYFKNKKSLRSKTLNSYLTNLFTSLFVLTTIWILFYMNPQWLTYLIFWAGAIMLISAPIIWSFISSFVIYSRLKVWDKIKITNDDISWRVIWLTPQVIQIALTNKYWEEIWEIKNIPNRKFIDWNFTKIIWNQAEENNFEMFTKETDTKKLEKILDLWLKNINSLTINNEMNLKPSYDISMTKDFQFVIKFKWYWNEESSLKIKKSLHKIISEEIIKRENKENDLIEEED